MRKYLIIKLLSISLAVIVFVMVIVWLSIDTLAANYFVTLMDKYNISPEPAHEMFISAVHRYLIWACLTAITITIILSFVLMRKVLRPLTRMTAISNDIAAGYFNVRVPVDTKDEIGQLALAFNHMAESLEKIENLRRTLMVDVAHELRTPLTNIRGYLEALTDNVIPPTKKTFSMLQDESIRLAQLVEDVLQLAKADAAHGHLKRESMDLREMIENTLKPFDHKLSEKSISIQVHAPDGPMEILVDAKRIVRVFKNMIDNAIRYSPANGLIEIRINFFSDCIRIAFINNNDNLTQKDIPYIFERFYRGEKSRSRKHGGAGIGLAIVKELIEAHGGHVGAELVADRIQIWVDLPKNNGALN